MQKNSDFKILCYDFCIKLELLVRQSEGRDISPSENIVPGYTTPAVHYGSLETFGTKVNRTKLSCRLN